MDVALAADGLGVAETRGHGLDGTDDIALETRLGIHRFEVP